MRWLESLLKRKIIVVFMVLFVIIFGIFSLNKLDIEMMPDITADGASIFISAGAMSSLDVETNITTSIEKVIASTNGVKSYSSKSSLGESNISVFFEKGRGDESFAKLESQLRAMEKQIEGIELLHIEQWGSTGYYDVFLDVFGGNLDEMSSFTREILQPRLEALPEVREVSVSGLTKNEIVIDLDRKQLTEIGLNVEQIMYLVLEENKNVSFGELSEEKNNPTLRWDTTLTEVNQLKNVSIPTKSGVLSLDDIAKIEIKKVENISHSWKNGDRNFIALDIASASNVTTVQMTNVVRNEIATIREEDLIGDFSVEEMFSSGDFITGAIDNGRNNVIFGGILAFFVILFFLRNIRATLVISLAIPITMLLTFSLMWIFGISINLISIIALGLGIGMIVDSSIVILESIYRKKVAGMSNFEAVIQGTKEVYTAVIASMLTTVVVFLPIGILADDIGEFIIIMSIVVVTILVSSVLISFTLIPALSENFVKVKERTTNQRENKIIRMYTGIVTWMTTKKWRPWLLASLFLFLFIASIPLLLFKVPMGYIPDIWNRQSEIMITLEEGTNHAEYDQIAGEIHQRLQNIPDIENYKLASIGSEYLWLFINMSATENATSKQEEVNNLILGSLRNMSSEFPVSDVSLALDMGSTVYPIEIIITGNEYDQLRELAEEIQERLEKVEGIESAKLSIKDLLQEEHFVLNHQAIKEAGLTPARIREYVEGLYSEQTIAEIDIDGVSTLVKMLFGQQIRSVNELQQHEIETDKGSKKLSEFVGFETKQFPKDITREDGIRTVKVMAHNEGRDLGSLGRDVQRVVNEVLVPQGYTISVGGQLEKQESSAIEMIYVLFIAIFLVYVVMGIQFNNWIHPFVVMSVIPMTFVGVILGLFITQRELNIMTAMGVVMLIGIVLNNAILLIDRTKQLRLKKVELNEALVEACKSRIRPIFLTTLTTAFGMLPLALTTGNGSNFQAPMATVVISGLLFATMITLVLIPAVYLIFEDVVRWPKKVWRLLRKRSNKVNDLKNVA